MSYELYNTFRGVHLHVELPATGLVGQLNELEHLLLGMQAAFLG